MDHHRQRNRGRADAQSPRVQERHPVRSTRNWPRVRMYGSRVETRR
jgi:hypothetical protein